MAQYHSSADLKHTLAHIAPKARLLLVQVEFEVFGNIHGKLIEAPVKDPHGSLGLTQD